MIKVEIAFTGKSGSGKTTLIEKISKKLSEKARVVVVKHDPKDKATFDTPNKDSDKFFKSGADTIVVSPTRTTMFKHTTSDLDSLKELAEGCDYFFIEGLKTFPLKRIGVFRETVDESYLDYVDFIAFKDVDETQFPSNLPKADLDDIDKIIEWINDNGKS